MCNADGTMPTGFLACISMAYTDTVPAEAAIEYKPEYALDMIKADQTCAGRRSRSRRQLTATDTVNRETTIGMDYVKKDGDSSLDEYKNLATAMGTKIDNDIVGKSDSDLMTAILNGVKEVNDALAGNSPNTVLPFMPTVDMAVAVSGDTANKGSTSVTLPSTVAYAVGNVTTADMTITLQPTKKTGPANSNTAATSSGVGKVSGNGRSMMIMVASMMMLVTSVASMISV